MFFNLNPTKNVLKCSPQQYAFCESGVFLIKRSFLDLLDFEVFFNFEF